MLVARKHLKIYFEVETQKLLHVFMGSQPEKSGMVAMEDPFHKMEYLRQKGKIVSILRKSETLL